jgi:choline dehydrogenase-like flavoprotein
VTGELSVQERRLRGLLLAHAIWSAILAVGYIASGDTATLGFIPNSFAKDMLFVTLSAIGAADVRRFGWTAVIVAIGYVALVVGQLATIALGGAPPQDVLGLFEVSGTVALLAWMAVDILLAIWLVAWWFGAVRAAHGLRYLHPVAFLSLVALAEVLIEGRREVVPPEEIARNVDGYLAELEAGEKTRVQQALIALGVWPLLTLRPPLPVLGPGARKRFLEKRFLAEGAAPGGFGPLRRLIQVIIRTGAQMSYLGYYGDRRAWADVGYTPYASRNGGRPTKPGDAPEPPLRSLSVPPRDRHYDAVIVGSGAAGAILAYRFAEAGRRVIVLERGPHVDPRRFTDDEVEQYLRLYNEGALQLATNFSLQVLQGMCVGGGTTINNALCLSPPTHVIDGWTQYGLDRLALERAIDEIRVWLEVAPIRLDTTTIAAQRFAAAVHELQLPGQMEVMAANITGGCLGCGYCNIGCGYGAKRAGLDFVLPAAQQRFGLDVLADVEVERIDYRGDHAVGVSGVHTGGERVSISADEVIVAAGPIGSSCLLQRSRIGGDAVGQGLHFNINSPLTAEFPDAVDSFAGIQMSHAYVAPGDPPGYLVETWFNPPATQALAMPGWFDRHFENMRRYRQMAAAGVLVGTSTPGSVRATPKGGVQIDYDASAPDRARMLEGLKVAGRIWLQAGARRVMPATFTWQEYRTPEQLDRLDGAVKETGDLMMTSAHPQGGNALGTVVDADFRVNGFKNLYLCDASVFPSSVHVNPQLTVMGMAQYAAQRILGNRRVTVAQLSR